MAFTRPVVASLVWNSLTTLGWACFLELYLQFCYSSAISRDPVIFTALSTWTLTGVMYSQLNIFLIKYVVFYRGAGVFASLDGVEAPKAPRCVSTLYLFGDMWRCVLYELIVWGLFYGVYIVGGLLYGLYRMGFIVWVYCMGFMVGGLLYGIIVWGFSYGVYCMGVPSHFVITSHFVIPVALCNNTCRTL